MSSKNYLIQQLREIGMHIKQNIPEILEILDEIVLEEFQQLNPREKRAAKMFHYNLYFARQTPSTMSSVFLYKMVILEEDVIILMQNK